MEQNGRLFIYIFTFFNPIRFDYAFKARAAIDSFQKKPLAKYYHGSRPGAECKKMS